MILVDLRDPNAKPWVVDEANLGGIGPRWGPTGLVAAIPAGTEPAPGHRRSRDPFDAYGLDAGARAGGWRPVDRAGQRTGAGSSASTESGAYEVVPIDGGDPRPGLAQVFDPRGRFGPGVAELRICSPHHWIARAVSMAASSASSSMGRPGRSGGKRATTGRWPPVSAAARTSTGSPWTTTTAGKSPSSTCTTGARTPSRRSTGNADWQDVAAPLEAPDHSAALVWIDIGAKPAAVLVPLTGAPADLPHRPIRRLRRQQRVGRVHHRAVRGAGGDPAGRRCGIRSAVGRRA